MYACIPSSTWFMSDMCRLCRHKNIIFSFGINQSTIISYITAPKVVTSHQGCSVLSSAWWWSPLERLPNCQPSHWTPSWPLNQAPHVDKVDISSPNQESPIFFKKTRQDLIGAKRTPGCAFLVFLKRKRWHRCNVVRDGRNAKAYALCSGRAKITRSQKVVQVCYSRAFLLLPVFFTPVFIFLRAKVVLFFFVVVIFVYFCCVSLSFLQLLLHW